MPSDDADLETLYSGQDYTDVDVNDGTRVSVVTEGESEYVIHQFKDHVGDNEACDLSWDGQSNIAPSSSTVYLQIYNYETPAWDAVDNDSAEDADTDFTLEGNIADLTDYKSGSDYITCRVYQEDI